MSDLREICFCGCGEPRNKFDPTNVEGWVTIFELAPWLNYLMVIHGTKNESEISEAVRFTDDGRAIYQGLVDEMHHGVKRRRKERKLAERWRKFSKESREKTSAFTASEGLPDPLELPPPREELLRQWLNDGVIPPVQDAE